MEMAHNITPGFNSGAEHPAMAAIAQALLLITLTPLTLAGPCDGPAMLGRRLCKMDGTTVRNGYPNVLLNVLLTTKSK